MDNKDECKDFPFGPVPTPIHNLLSEISRDIESILLKISVLKEAIEEELS